MNWNADYYQSPPQNIGQGRPSPPEKGTQYWYQNVQTGNLDQLTPATQSTIGLLGYACDEGVRRNLGRPGAKAGPEAFRKQFAKLACHFPNQPVLDFGTICCDDQNLEAAQQNLSLAVQRLRENAVFPLVVGGGHDVAYGHGRGLLHHIQKNTPEQRLGIVNFDAHFDLRPLSDAPSSGTPFYQLLEEFGTEVAYFAVGIQPPANPPELFEIAEAHGVAFVLSESCQEQHLKAALGQLRTFLARVEQVYITIDLDGFASAFAPGVSAPSPMGFSPQFVLQLLRVLWESGKVIALDMAELNPEYDQDQRTATLAARLAEAAIRYTQAKG